MNVFDFRDRLVSDYARYIRSFIKIADPRIQDKVETSLSAGAFWPDPLLQLNPTFLPGGTIDESVGKRILHPECARILNVNRADTDHTGKPLLLRTHKKKPFFKSRMTGLPTVLATGTVPTSIQDRQVDSEKRAGSLAFASLVHPRTIPLILVILERRTPIFNA